MSRHWIQEQIYASPRLRRAYAALGMRKARRAWAQGDVHNALAHGLRAWKHSAAGGFAPKHANLVRSWIAHVSRDTAGDLQPVADNAAWAAWKAHEESVSTRKDFGAYPVEDRARMRTPKPDAPAWRVGDLVVLKRHNPDTGELGAILITYNHGIEWLSALYDLAQLAGKYVVVLEPSTWGYQDVCFVPYIGSDLDVIVHAQSTPDHEFIASLDCNLVASHLGAGDWVDPARFHPKPRSERAFDIAMVGSWDPLKRHVLLFDAMRTLRKSGRDCKAAFVGYPLGWTQADVEREAKRFGVHDLCTFYNFIPYDEVGQVLANSRVSVLLSKREGANRAIYESWMADTPTIVYRHHRGVNLRQVTPTNGLLATDEELVAALTQALDHGDAFSPRAWALENTGCHAATARLNAELQAISKRSGRPWTLDAVPRTYAGYLTPEDQNAMGEEYTALAEHLLPPS